MRFIGMVSVLTAACFMRIGSAQQSSADLVGTVRDSAGGILVGAKVLLTRTETNIRQSVSTNSEGTYIFTALQPGGYAIEAEFDGFKRKRYDNIIIQIGNRTRLDIDLDIGAVSDTITVEVTTPMMETESATIGTVMPHKAVVDLPLNGRDFNQLVGLAPGVIAGSNGGLGTPLHGNTFNIDGGASRDPYGGGSVLSPIIDSLAEFRVQVGQYSAESGFSGGLVIDAATRSGTNDLHGTLWEFHRNRVLDAPSFFSAVDSSGNKIKGPLIRNQFGFVVGGPIIKNRTFAFGAYEGLRLPSSRTWTARLPTAAEKSGNLSAYSTYFGRRIVDPSTGSPFPGDIIPANRIDPISRRILDDLFIDPTSSDPLRNWVVAQDTATRTNNWSVRVDHQLSANHNIFARYNQGNDYSYSVGYFSMGMPLGYGDRIVENRPRQTTVGLTSTFTPHLINTFRVGRTSSDYNSGAAPGGLDAFGGCLGLGLEEPQCRKGTPLGGLPAFGIQRTALSSGGASLDFQAATPFVARGWFWQFQDNLTWSLNKHTLRFGTDIQKHRGRALVDRWGSINFGGNYSGDGFSDFLLGFPTGLSGRLDTTTPYELSTWLLSGYVQDDWKVTPNLTLNLGARYEVTTSLIEGSGQVPSFDPLLGTGTEFEVQKGDCPIDPRACGGLVYPANNKSAREFYQTYRPDVPFGISNTNAATPLDGNNWAPRLGFAYRPFGNTRTVVRGGYGVFYFFRPMLNTLRSLGSTFPNEITISATGNASVPDLNYQTLPDRVNNAEDPFSITGRIGVSPVGTWLNPMTHQWSFSVAHNFGRQTVFEMQYAGNKSSDLVVPVEQNRTTPGPGTVVDRLPFAKFNNITQYFNPGFANYHGGIFSLKRSMGDGVTFSAGYTYSKAMAGGGASGSRDSSTFVQIADDLSNYRYRSGEDVRHGLNGYAIWALPIGHGQRFGSSVSPVLDKFIGGWQMSGIFIARTGLPFTMLLPVSLCNAASSPALRCFPNRLNNPGDTTPLSNGVDTPKYLSSNFPSPSFTFGNAGANILEDNGLWNVDWALMKNTVFHERYRVEFRFEAFNVLNHPTFGAGMNTDPSSASFGRVFSSGEPRRLQLGLKFHF